MSKKGSLVVTTYWRPSKLIPEFQLCNYWKVLEHQIINSQQRRLGSLYIHTLKVIEWLAPNYGITANGNTLDIMGRKCLMSTHKRKPRVQTLREQLFQCHGPRLFNALPKHIQNINHCASSGSCLVPAQQLQLPVRPDQGTPTRSEHQDPLIKV